MESTQENDEYTFGELSFLGITKKKPKVVQLSIQEVRQAHASRGLDLSSYDIPASNEEAERVPVTHPLDLPNALTARMFEHQKEGVQWMYDLRARHRGGILGDDMGLGKTFQTVAFMTGLIRSKLAQTFLIIAPLSVLPAWIRELEAHLQPYVKTKLIIDLMNSEMKPKQRQRVLEVAKTTIATHIIVSSYQLVTNMISDIERVTFDYVILDEGHTMKNPTTKLSKAMSDLRSHHRLLLTGTAVQNRLKELWVLLDWATRGKVLGRQKEFEQRYADPINRGQDPKASNEQQMISKKVAKSLLHTIRPVYLQRKKCEKKETLKLTNKTEVVVWIPLATYQRELYEEYLRSRTFKDAMSNLEGKQIPIEAVNYLKTLSRHPLLIEASLINKRRNECKKKQQHQQPSRTPQSSMKNYLKDAECTNDDIDGLVDNFSSMRIKKKDASTNNSNFRDGNNDDGDSSFTSQKAKAQAWATNNLGGASASSSASSSSSYSSNFDVDCVSLPVNADLFSIVGKTPDTDELFKGSVKLRVLFKLLRRLLKNGHKTLVFSQSKLMHDIIENVLNEYGIACYRIDGTVASSERQLIIDEFNDEKQKEISVCLLTTGSCGVGITLTGADRVIIFDPSWNPAQDRQAVDRAFRIGQQKDVVVYRMIMASSVEEKMYEKQVFKDGLRVVAESGESSKYFSEDDTKELFQLGAADRSVVMEKLWGITGGNEMRSFDDTRGDLKGVLGYTRHDELYSEVRPQEIQKRLDLFTTPQKSPHNQSVSPQIVSTTGKKPKNIRDAIIAKENDEKLVNSQERVDDDVISIQDDGDTGEYDVDGDFCSSDHCGDKGQDNDDDDDDDMLLKDGTMASNNGNNVRRRVILDDDDEDECDFISNKINDPVNAAPRTPTPVLPECYDDEPNCCQEANNKDINLVDAVPRTPTPVLPECKDDGDVCLLASGVTSRKKKNKKTEFSLGFHDSERNSIECDLGALLNDHQVPTPEGIDRHKDTDEVVTDGSNGPSSMFISDDTLKCDLNRVDGGENEKRKTLVLIDDDNEDYHCNDGVIDVQAVGSSSAVPLEDRRVTLVLPDDGGESDHANDGDIDVQAVGSSSAVPLEDRRATLVLPDDGGESDHANESKNDNQYDRCDRRKTWVLPEGSDDEGSESFNSDIHDDFVDLEEDSDSSNHEGSEEDEEENEQRALKAHALTPGYKRVIVDDDDDDDDDNDDVDGEACTLSSYDFTVSTPLSTKSADKPSQRHIRQSISPIPPRPSLLSQNSIEFQQQQVISTPIAANVVPRRSDVDDFMNSPIPDKAWLDLVEKVENMDIKDSSKLK